MGATRLYTFTTSVQTSTKPSAGTPTVDDDILTKGFGDGNYTPRASWEQTVANIAALRALPEVSTARSDRQTSLVHDIDTFYAWDSGSSAVDDGDTIITPNDTTGPGRWLKRSIGGGGGGGAGSSITTIDRGELINPLSGVYLHEKQFIEITDSNKFIDVNEGGGELNAVVATGKYLFDSDENIQELTDAMAAALDAVGGLTYDVSFSQITRKFTIAASGSFTILLNTGTNAANDLTEFLGWIGASDTGSAASHEADDSVDTAGNLDAGLFWFATDADVVGKSSAYWGVDESGGAKFSTATVKSLTPVSGFTNSDLGTVFTLSGAIVIDSTNNKLDLDEGGGQLSATISNGVYAAPYDSLMAELVTQLQAVGGDNYVCTYDGDTDKITLASDGAFSLQWNTGPNTSVTIGEILGFIISSDDGSLSSHEADNTVNLKGKLGFASDSKITGNSIDAGVAIDDEKIYPKRATDQSYIDVTGSEKFWQTNPSVNEKVFANEGVMLTEHQNENGYGVRVWGEAETGQVYRMQRKLGNNDTWKDAATTIPVQLNAGANKLGENLSWENYWLLSHVYVDENNKAVFAHIVSDGSLANRWGVYAYYSNDLDTWTKATGPDANGAIKSSATETYHISDIYIRESKCVVLVSNAANDESYISISDDSGSGYTTFANTSIAGVLTMRYDKPAWIRLQFFSAEAGINQHRIICCGNEPGNDRGRIVYGKGDGSSLASISEANMWGAVNTQLGLCAGVDKDPSGNRNRLSFIGTNLTSNVINQSYSNTDYNGGTLTMTNDTLQDISPDNTLAHDQSNGKSATDPSTLELNQSKRAIIVGNKAYALVNLNGGQELHLMYTLDITVGTWSFITLKDDGAADLSFEYNMQHIAETSEIQVMFKRSDAIGNNFTKGQIYAGKVSVAGDGTPIFDAAGFAQIDETQTLADFLGFCTSSASALTMNCSFEKYDGTTKDNLWNNKYS